MSDIAYDKLCKALEFADRTVEFYRDELDGCPDGLGREVFEMLLDRAEEALDSVVAAQEALRDGGAWSDVCPLAPEDEEDVKDTFGAFAAKYEGEVCSTENDVIEAGLEMEKTILDFYSEWEDEAGDETEQQFVRRMVVFLDDNVSMLNDLVYYYEDPEGWSMSGGLEGA